MEEVLNELSGREFKEEISNSPLLLIEDCREVSVN